MFKKLAPLLTVLLSVFIDSAVVPVFYTGVFCVPLTLITVVEIGVLRGRTLGMLYGMLGGLLLDITVGTLGLKFFPFVAIGFLIGFLVYQGEELPRPAHAGIDWMGLARRAIWTFILLAVYEAAMLVIQYFSTAILEWSYIRNIFLRALLMTFLSVALHPVFHKFYIGKVKPSGASRTTREVKSF